MKNNSGTEQCSTGKAVLIKYVTSMRPCLLKRGEKEVEN